MDLERIVKELQDLADTGDVAVRRLREGAAVLGRKQLSAFRAEARGQLVGRLTALALKIATSDARGLPAPARSDQELAAEIGVQNGDTHARG
jgi:hypothetical protein